MGTDGFWGNIFRRSAVPGKHALLRGIPIFEDLGPRELRVLEPLLHRRTYAAAECVFRQGDPGVGMYVIEHGRIAIDSETSHVRIAELGDGEFFGEIALFNETPRSATARALTPAVLYGLFQPDLLDLVQRNPRLGVKLLLALTQIAGQRLLAVEAQVDMLRRRLDAAGHANGIQPHDLDAPTRPDSERTVD